jgi:hypothetical protein
MATDRSLGDGAYFGLSTVTGHGLAKAQNEDLPKDLCATRSEPQRVGCFREL